MTIGGMALPPMHIGAMGPEIVLLVAALLALLVALFFREGEGTGLLAGIGVAGILVALGWTFFLWGSPEPAYAFGRSFVADHASVILDWTILLSALAGILVVGRDIEVSPDFVALLLCSAIGMMVMAGANDLIVLFLGLEILSLPLYILAAFHPRRETSLEAAVKYFLLGAFSSGFFLFGLAMLYGATGTTNIQAIAGILTGASGHGPLSTLLVDAGAGLIVVGLGFKLALVPFHMWAPDVYEGAPTSVTTFMSVGVKAAAFGALARIVLVAVPLGILPWRPVLEALALITILAGALLSLPQTNLKRLLAYSSVLNAGYLAAALSTQSALGLASGLYFMVAYAFMNLGAFAVVAALSTDHDEGADLAAYRGLFYRQPYVALAMAVFLFALASIPPTAGFVAKFYILESLVAGSDLPLAMGLVLGTAITLYVYLHPIISMFQRDERDARPVRRIPVAMAVLLAVLAVGVIEIGIDPGEIVRLVHVSTGVMTGL